MRKFSEFMIWNHIFILFEVIYAFIKKEYLLFILGFITFLLSTLRHLYNETRFNTIEPFIAKFTLSYILLISWLYFTLYQNILLSIIKVVMLFVWKLEHYNYEYIHPWLHILSAIDTHCYLYLLYT